MTRDELELLVRLGLRIEQVAVLDQRGNLLALVINLLVNERLKFLEIKTVIAILDGPSSSSESKLSNASTITPSSLASSDS